jgi:two-component system response regulator RegA
VNTIENTDCERSDDPATRELVLVVDDDGPFSQRLARAIENRGFMVKTVGTVADALSLVGHSAPPFAVVDIRLNDGSGLDVVSALTRARPDARAIVLTGYGNIATAVNAIKCGAADYLAKPANADEILGALLARSDREPPAPDKPMSPNRVRWEHIQRVLELCGRNVSDTARRLRMHRRTLQRILAKRAPQ